MADYCYKWRCPECGHSSDVAGTFSDLQECGGCGHRCYVPPPAPEEYQDWSDDGPWATARVVAAIILLVLLILLILMGGRLVL